MQVMCIDGDFTGFMETYGYDYNFPKEGHVYEVRADNGRGGYLLNGISNPYWIVSVNPLLFEEIHFNKHRFVEFQEVKTVAPYFIHAN